MEGTLVNLRKDQLTSWKNNEIVKLEEIIKIVKFGEKNKGY